MRYCSECGSKVEEGSHFCPGCGHVLGPPTAAPRVAMPVEGTSAVAPTYPVPIQAEPMPVAPVYPMPLPAAQPAADRTVPAVPFGATGRWISRNRWVFLTFVALASLLIGVVAGFVLPARDAGEIVADVPVGPGGASVTFDGQGKLEIPKGAIAKPERIIIRKTVIRERVSANSPAGIPLVFPPGTLAVYIFQPANLTFTVPVTIILPLPAGAPAGIIFVFANGQLRFFGGRINLANRTIRAQAMSFGFVAYGAAALPGAQR